VHVLHLEPERRLERGRGIPRHYVRVPEPVKADSPPCRPIIEAFTWMPLKKMVQTCVPLKNLFAPVCHRPKLLCPLCHSVHDLLEIHC
jgi:hypothetical protein